MCKRWPIVGLIALLLIAAGIYVSFGPASEAQEVQRLHDIAVRWR